jgi:hypothetical protein
MDTGTPALIDHGRGMTVADLQTYLTNLADAVAAATRSDLAAREMRAAVEALEPFGQLSLEALSGFLKVAWEYAQTGKVPAPIGKKAFRKRRTAEELTAALQDLRIRAASDPQLSRATVEEALKDFRYSLSHGELRGIVTALGVPSAHKMMTRESLMSALVEHVMNSRTAIERASSGAEEVTP